MGGERESRESRVCVHRVCVRVVAVVVALHAPGRRGENFSLHLRFFLAFFFFLCVCVVSPFGCLRLTARERGRETPMR